MKVDVDDVSWQILAALQENARLTYRELGRRVGLTPPAVAERIRRLEDAGIIAGYRVQLNVDKLGLPIRAIIRLAPRGRNAADVRRLVSALPQVLACHHVTGEDCYVLDVAVPSVGDLERLLERLLRYGDTTTSMVLSTPVTHRVIGPDVLAGEPSGGELDARRSHAIGRQ
jgi:Lrp/AsnC family transcriptional regulator, leucine-responsive regulatory protein